MKSKIDINRIEYQNTIGTYQTSAEERAAKILGEYQKAGLLAIAYAIADLADATRNPEWTKP